MSDCKSKVYQIVCRLGLRPRPRWGSLQRSPRLPSWILGGLLLRGRGRDKRRREGGEGRKGEEKGKGEEREGKGREGAGSAPQVKSLAPHYYFRGAGADWNPTIMKSMVADSPKFQSLYNSATDCSISRKFGTEFDRATASMNYKCSRSTSQRSRS